MGNLHEKHRSRLDEKVRRNGAESLAEHELLEFILFTAIPRGDTNALAHRLLDEFGSMSGVFNAEIESLMKIEGVGRRTAVFLTSMPQVSAYVQRGILTGGSAPRLEKPKEIGEYVKTFFFGKLVECAYIFTLNTQNRLINFHKVSEGDAQETAIYISEIVRMAILDHASGMIIAHNHPGGTLTPSPPDIQFSKDLMKALRAVNITLFESVIVAGGDYCNLVYEGHVWIF